VDATASGQTRADTIRGRLSAPTNLQKKESYCVIPTGNTLLNCIYPAFALKLEGTSREVVRFH
jgi:hypothetical protein